MPCKIPCIEEISGTDREKWEYVVAHYAAIAPNDADEQFLTDWNNWQVDIDAGRDVIFEKWIQWRCQTGSVHYGNLPEFVKTQNVGHCHAPCPYSTQSSAGRTRIMLGLDQTDPLPRPSQPTAIRAVATTASSTGGRDTVPRRTWMQYRAHHTGKCHCCHRPS